MFVKTHTHRVDVTLSKEQRQDPITGEVLQLNDEVVFCASCKSAFLVDSWHYLGKKHCGQQDTLEQTPHHKHLVVRKLATTLSQPVQETAFSFFHALQQKKVLFNAATYRLRLSMDTYTFFVGFLVLTALVNLVWISARIQQLSLPIWVFVLGLVGFFYIKSLVEWVLGKSLMPYKNLKIHTDKLVFVEKWRNAHEIKYAAVKNIVFHIPTNCSIWNRPTLFIFLRNGTIHRIKLASMGECRRACLDALAHISAKTTVKLELMSTIDKQYSEQLQNLLDAKFSS